MYTREQIDKFGYFKDIELSHLLDSLTGVISRGYILNLAKELVNSNTPFTMLMFDIDNFKFINDNYGHAIGDECLIAVCDSLIRCVEDKALIGRYGGDEFIIIYFGEHSYEESHSFANSLYGTDKAVRRSYLLSTAELFITATTGNASFPKDANNYDDLFLMVDKALYRGKTKGRNCYITYVKEKHEHIDVHKKGTDSLNILFRTLLDIVTLQEKRDVTIKYLLNNITSFLGVKDSIFVKTDGHSISSSSIRKFDTPEIYQVLVDNSTVYEELFYPTEINFYKRTAKKEIQEWIDKEDISTFIVSKVRNTSEYFGSIILIEKNVQRIWQDKDKALLMYVDRLIELLYK
jgi:diguanylate cyclase (GGDEF)-like protein